MKSIIIAILMLTSVSAIYSGESIYFDLQDQIENLQTVSCEILNNNTNLEGLNLTVNNTGYTISTVVNFQPNNLTVSCLLNGYKIVNSNSESSSSSSCGSWFCFTNWTCSEWSECLNNISTRECNKTAKGCFGKLTEKPIEIKECLIVQLNNTCVGDICDLPNNDVIIEDNSLINKILVGLCVLAVIILIIIITLSFHLKKLKK